MIKNTLYLIYTFYYIIKYVQQLLYLCGKDKIEIINLFLCVSLMCLMKYVFT